MASGTAYSSSASQIPSLSPAELSYLHTSLSYPNNPIRTDGRSATQFRPLTAETDILSGANGSARIGFADGTQAIVGVKAEVERTVVGSVLDGDGDLGGEEGGGGNEEGTEEGTEEGEARKRAGRRGGESSWVEMSIEIPGLRDDDSLPVFLAEMMREALMVSGSGTEGGGDGNGGMPQGLKGRLVINGGWHWRIYIDILLLSAPLSYPLPLLSLTTHLALLSTKLPRLISKDEEDPMFDDDWAAAEYLYPRRQPQSQPQQQTQTKPFPIPSTTLHLYPFRPPVTLLVISVGDNIIFDPSREEIAVAEAVLAVSIGRDTSTPTNKGSSDNSTSSLKLLSIRTIDPPSRLTHPGIPNSENAATIGFAAGGEIADKMGAVTGGAAVDSGEDVAGVWRPRRGGVKRSVVSRIVSMVLKKGGVGEEVMEGLEGVEVG
ncbi:hypothetical protein PAAG_06270 [Paracoccidioides lutzii Pb01]|uniref:Ribosomal RNA-processing protein 42 n=1 Tax=Paracoccidioides lutzii (strain ATCC MYA-826 / Pb01) TaxID=502779 RepID=C1H5S5_PARBA|nr:hypothetical protein PAAG_06270 [Paracoccidioides lutzii Pb01]EEH35223.1 hypothetical protein PAAG_06270 [Paracoccidioides lutzii Pb01]